MAIDSLEDPKDFELRETINGIKIALWYNHILNYYEIGIAGIQHWGTIYTDEQGIEHSINPSISTCTVDPTKAEEYFNNACDLARQGKKKEEIMVELGKMWKHL